MNYRNIESELELHIRQGFSNDLPEFRAIKGWLDGAFKQMVSHRADMYTFNSRVKQVESLLKKFDDKIGSEDLASSGRWKSIHHYDSLKDNIDDIIGGRLITYFVRDLPKLLLYLVKFKRFDVVAVTVHDMFSHPILYRNILDELKIDAVTSRATEEALKSTGNTLFNIDAETNRDLDISAKIPIEIRLNANGYVGIHMIIKPIPYDDYYENEPGIYGKFELQVRSLIHEAWSEIQHKIIYKGQRMPDEVKFARTSHFASISNILSSCEDSLYDAAIEMQEREDD